MNHMLIVDDEAEIRESLEGILREEELRGATAATAGRGAGAAARCGVRVVLLDIWLPDREDWRCWRRCKALENRPEVVIISGHGTIETAVKATKLGAYDFLEKPLSLDRTLIVVKNAVEARRLRREPGVQAAVQRDGDRGERAAEGAAAADPADGADQRAGADLWRAGTGKELIARAIHAESLRRDRVFVELNCAAIPEDYIESGAVRLSGRGAATVGRRKARHVRAGRGGTLFLDEVGDMSLKTQAKVLRALDEQRFPPVGATHPLHVDVRVIAATNKDLEEEIAQGNFREDLFYRLNVVPFFVPPLRERSRIFRCWRRSFCRSSGGSMDGRGWRSAKRRWRRCAGITGREMCAN